MPAARRSQGYRGDRRTSPQRWWWSPPTPCRAAPAFHCRSPRSEVEQQRRRNTPGGGRRPARLPGRSSPRTRPAAAPAAEMAADQHDVPASSAARGNHRRKPSAAEIEGQRTCSGLGHRATDQRRPRSSPTSASSTRPDQRREYRAGRRPVRTVEHRAEATPAARDPVRGDASTVIQQHEIKARRIDAADPGSRGPGRSRVTAGASRSGRWRPRSSATRCPGLQPSRQKPERQSASGTRRCRSATCWASQVIGCR